MLEKIELESEILENLLKVYNTYKNDKVHYQIIIDQIGLRINPLYALIHFKDRKKGEKLVKDEEVRYHLKILKAVTEVDAKKYEDAADTIFSTTDLATDYSFKDFGYGETDNKNRRKLYEILNKRYIGLVSKLMDKYSQNNRFFLMLKRVYPGLSKKYFLSKLDIYVEKSVIGLEKKIKELKKEEEEKELKLKKKEQEKILTNTKPSDN